LFLFLFGVALVVMAPLGEEIVFRGFLFRGLGASLGPVAAVILTSLGWAALHVQYEVFFIVQIFVIGLIFGGLRWWSGSLYLVIVLHALINAIAFVQAIYATPVLA
jgi:membrane protease YdiL (CAAX protease family)